jgi:hypothetical protein
MKVTVTFVGYVRKSEIHSRALVLASGMYYTWKDKTSEVVKAEQERSFILDSELLEFATDHQVIIGRNNSFLSRDVVVTVTVCGEIQRGKNNVRLLVRQNESYFTVAVPVESDYEKDKTILVDKRKMTEARSDQISAGLGKGTLKRKRKNGEVV